MARKSIGQLHSEVTANASQFVNEFQRADNAQRRASASIRAGVQKMVRDVQRDFSLPKLGKGLLSGMGIGGGMQLSSMLVDKFAEVWRAGAENAKEMAEHVDRIQTALRSMQGRRFESMIGAMPDDTDKLAAIGRQISSKQATRDREIAERKNAEDMVRAGGEFGGITEWAKRKFGDVTSTEAMKKASELITVQQGKIEGLDEEIEQLVDSMKSTSKKIAEDVDRTYKENEKAAEEFNAEMAKTDEHIRDLGQRFKDSIATPSERFVERVNEMAALRRLGAITEDDTRRGLREAQRKLAEESDPTKTDTFRRWERAAGDIKVDDMTRRGLGTGANYQDIGKQTNQILAEIADLMRRAIANGYSGNYAD